MRRKGREKTGKGRREEGIEGERRGRGEEGKGRRERGEKRGK